MLTSSTASEIYTPEEQAAAKSYIETLRRFEAHWRITHEWLEVNIKNIAGQIGFPINERTLDNRILAEVVFRYNRDIERIMIISLPNGVSAFKQGGHLTFWIRKLKPIIPPLDTNKWQRINEAFAFRIGLGLVRTTYPGNIAGYGTTREKRAENLGAFYKDFIYSLRYGPVSPTSISLTYFAIWNLKRDH